MCGIVAYIGNKKCKSILINGLKRLEYRGYDSAGIAILSPVQNEKFEKMGKPRFQIKVEKEAGKIKVLEDLVKNIDMDGFCGIGHTRWATHGEPSKVNAHPHFDCTEKIAVVHNGIIENYSEIKEELIQKGHKFISQTDTEVLPHLLEEYLKSENIGDLQVAMHKLLRKIRGSGAIVAISTDFPEEIVASSIPCRIS